LKLTGTNSSFTGKFWGYSGGSTEVSSLANQDVNSSIGAGNLIHLGTSANGGTLDYRGDGDSTDRQVVIGSGAGATHSGGATIRNNGTGALVFTALNFNFATNNAGASRILTLGGSNAGNNVISGIIADNRDDTTGRVSLVKANAGKWILSGNNTYKGTTAVNAGTLIIDGDQTNATGAVTVSMGAVLGGSGTIGGNTTISGKHTPGNSPGIQTFAGNLTYEGGAAEVVWELAKNTMIQESPAVFDQILVGGNLEFTGLTKLAVMFDVDSGSVEWTNSFWNSNRSWLIYDVAGTTAGFSNLVFGSTDWADKNGGLLSVERAGATFTLTQDGNDIKLNYVVPEPTALSLLGLATVMMLVGRRFATRR
jgi:autotransporter-associated beta strand protein